jgi:hypothetical protein
MEKRCRMLSIRLSYPEYEELKNLCSVHGARSISDLARRAIAEMLGKNGNPGDDKLNTHVSELSRKVYYLDREVERLSRIVEPASQPASGGPAATNEGLS